MLTTLQDMLMRLTTFTTFQLQDDLLGSLSLLMKHRFCLSSISCLLAIIAALSLSCGAGFTGLLLPGDGMALMLVTLLAVCILLLRIVHLYTHTTYIQV